MPGAGGDIAARLSFEMEDIMADRVPASIELGGVIHAAAYAELVSVIQSEGLSVEWDGESFEPDHRTEGELLRLHAYEVAWGRFDALEAFCIGKGLPFVRWSGGYGGNFGPERLVFTGDGERNSYEANEDDEVVIGRYLVTELGSHEAVLAYFDAANFKVPPLVIEG